MSIGDLYADGGLVEGSWRLARKHGSGWLVTMGKILEAGN